MECLKQQTFISYISGGLEIHDQGTNKLGVWWGPASRFGDSCHLATSSRGREISFWDLYLLVRVHIPSWGLYSQNLIQTWLPPKSPPSSAVTLGIKLPHMNLGKIETFSSQQMPWWWDGVWLTLFHPYMCSLVLPVPEARGITLILQWTLPGCTQPIVGL